MHLPQRSTGSYQTFQRRPYATALIIGLYHPHILGSYLHSCPFIDAPDARTAHDTVTQPVPAATRHSVRRPYATALIIGLYHPHILGSYLHSCPFI